MSLDIQNVNIDFNQILNYPIPSVKGDTGREIQFAIFNKGIPVDLTGEQVKVFGIKPDNYRIFANLEIIDEANGICSLKLTPQMLCVEGIVRCTLVRYAGGLKLSSRKFNIEVSGSVADDIEIESTNEYLALTDALSVTEGNIKTEVNAVLKQMIDDGKLTNMTIGDNSIETAKYKNGSVTPEKLSQAYSDALVKSGKAKNLLINDCMNNNVATIKNTDKVFAGGINFYNLPDTAETTLNGITYSINNGVITLDGTATANTEIYLTNPISFNVYKDFKYYCTVFKVGGSFTQGTIAPKLRCSATYKMYNLMDAVLSSFSGGDVHTEAVTSITENFKNDRMCIYVTNGSTFSKFKCKFQLELNGYCGVYDYGNIPQELAAGTHKITITDHAKIQGNSEFEYSYPVSLNRVDFGKANYSDFTDKPTINGVTIQGDLSSKDLGIVSGTGIINKKYNAYKENLSKANITLAYSYTGSGTFFPSVVSGVIQDTYTYSVPVSPGTIFPADKGIVQNTPRKLGVAIDWWANCSELDIRVYTTSRGVLVVDDEIIGLDLYPNEGSGINSIHVNFGTKAKRHIRFYYTGKSFQGCYADGEITKYEEEKPMFITDGDSIVEGLAAIGATNGMVQCYVSVVAQRLGLNLLNCGVGGSGYNAQGNMSEPNMVDRFDTYIKPYLTKNSILLVSGGLNDTSKATLDDIKTNIDTYWANVKNINATPYVIMMSPFNPSANLTGVANLQEVNEYLKAKAMELEYPYIDIMNGKTYDAAGTLIAEYGQFITANNVAKYISSDNCHPTKEGSKALGNRVSMEVYRILKDNFGLLNV